MVSRSLIHIVFLETKQELLPAFLITFDVIATAITFIYAIIVIADIVRFESTGIDDFYVGAVEIGGGALMILTGYVWMKELDNQLD